MCELPRLQAYWSMDDSKEEKAGSAAAKRETYRALLHKLPSGCVPVCQPA